jgi:hypothetical protein
MVIDAGKNSQTSEDDDETTMELERLSGEACADSVLPGDSPAESDSDSETQGPQENRIEAEAAVSGEDLSEIEELRDELKFRAEMNSILHLGVDQERDKCRRLTEQLASVKKTSERFNDELKRSQKQLTKTKKKLAKARNRENVLLVKLKKMSKADAANAVVADQDGAIEELRKDNLKLANVVSDLEAKLEIAKQDYDYLERRTSEANTENANLLVELESRNTQIDDYKNQLTASRHASRASEKTSRARAPEARPMPHSQIEDRWVLIGLDGDVPDIYLPSDETVTIGSSPDSDIQIESKFISRHHAQLVKNKNGCVLGDLNSTNGTFVNSRRINKRVLRAGDTVTIGKHRFRYQKRSAESI